MASATPNKADKLAAMAQAGKTGGDAYDAAIQSLQAMRNDAVNSAAARAGALNAPQAFLNRQAGIAAQPGDTATTMLRSLQSGARSHQAALNSATGAYLNQLSGAQGVIRKRLESQLGGIKDQAQAKAYDTVLKLMSQQDALAAKQERQAKAQAEAEQDHARQFTVKELDNPNSKYSDATRNIGKKLVTQTSSYDQALKAITEDGDGNSLTAEDWAKQGVNMQDLLDLAMMYYRPKDYFLTHSSNPLAYSPPGTPGGFDLAQ